MTTISTAKKSNTTQKVTDVTINFFTEVPPKKLSVYIRTLLMDHLIEVAGNYGIEQKMIIDLQKFFDFMEQMQRLQKKWKTMHDKKITTA